MRRKTVILLLTTMMIVPVVVGPGDANVSDHSHADQSGDSLALGGGEDDDNLSDNINSSDNILSADV